MMGKRLQSALHLELDDEATRDELLRGMRLIRMNKSMLFKQRLDEMMESGMV